MRLTRFTLLTIFLISAFAISASAQRFYGAVSAGMNMSQVDGDEVYGFHKFGLNAGPSVMFPFGGKNKRWSVTMELLYSQIGSYQREEYPNDNSGNIDSTKFYDGYKLNLNYAQIPLLVHYTDKNFIAGGVGFLYGQLVGWKEWEDHNDERGMYRTDTLGDFYKKQDLQILADVRLRIYKRLWFNFRYGYSILPIRTRTYENPFTHTTWTRKQYNNVLTFRLTYIFNEPLPAKAKK